MVWAVSALVCILSYVFLNFRFPKAASSAVKEVWLQGAVAPCSVSLMNSSPPGASCRTRWMRVDVSITWGLGSQGASHICTPFWSTVLSLYIKPLNQGSCQFRAALCHVNYHSFFFFTLPLGLRLCPGELAGKKYENFIAVTKSYGVEFII